MINTPVLETQKQMLKTHNEEMYMKMGKTNLYLTQNVLQDT